MDGNDIQRQLLAQMLTAVLSVDKKVADASAAAAARRHALEQEFRAKLTSDPAIKEADAQANSWREAYLTAAKELFQPGSVIRRLDEFFIVDHVDLAYIYVWKVCDPPSRSKSPGWVLVSDKTVPVLLEDIPEGKLRRLAGKLIAKVRLKDW
jgi:hypothetical protein